MITTTIRDLKEFEAGKKIVLQVRDIIVNPVYCSIIDFTEDYFNLVTNLIDYAKNNNIESEVIKELEELQSLIRRIVKGNRGDYDDLGDME